MNRKVSKQDRIDLENEIRTDLEYSNLLFNRMVKFVIDNAPEELSKYASGLKPIPKQEIDLAVKRMLIREIKLYKSGKHDKLFTSENIGK